MAKPPPKPTGTPPTISGVPRVGQTLHASDGSWSGGPVSFGKQWLQDTSPIIGATVAGLGAIFALPLHAAQSDPAADYPNKPIRFIVPFAPGAGVDTTRPRCASA